MMIDLYYESSAITRYFLSTSSLRIEASYLYIPFGCYNLPDNSFLTTNATSAIREVK